MNSPVARLCIPTSIVTRLLGYGLDETGSIPGRDIFFLFGTTSRLALRPTQPPNQWVSGAMSLEVKRPGREDDLSPPRSTEVKNACTYTSPPTHMSSWRRAWFSRRTILLYITYFIVILVAHFKMISDATPESITDVT
jgi:hypothetical protein